MKKFILLTGATGLLGRFLMRDLLLKGFQLAVLVRPIRGRTAAQRIDDVLSRGLPTPFPAGLRPVIIEGSLDGAGSQISIGKVEREWISMHVKSILNSAASLDFEYSIRSNEPFRTNVEGTRALLELCASAGVSSFHHISTAYICGDRSGPISEMDVDCGQTLRNAYEKSKLLAELAIRDFAYRFDTVTFYRPSIIVGDYTWGFTPTFHGFYLPLKVLDTLSKQGPIPFEAADFFSVLGIGSDDSKNLVPVDWVSAVITRIVCDQRLHGYTYHVTNKQPTSIGLISFAFAEVLNGSDNRHHSTNDVATLPKTFMEQMDPYRAYWGNDPEFDQRHLEVAVPDLPAPELSRRALIRLARFALEKRFTVPY